MSQNQTLHAVAMVAAAFAVTTTLFMNCSKDLPPSALQAQSSKALPIVATYSPNPAYRGSNVTITATGGVPPFTYLKMQGAGTLTDNEYAAPSADETASVKVSDSTGEYVNVLIPITIDPGSAAIEAVTPGSASFSTAGAFTFTVPKHNAMTVEVWGGGAGGQDCGIANSIPVCYNGSAGGDSRFDVLVGGGGKLSIGGKGTGGTANFDGEAENGNGNLCPGLGGASGGPLGSATRQGKTPGGGGNGVCFGWGAHAGGGGGYASKTYYTGQLIEGTVINGTVGAAGASRGAPGLVQITWH